MSYWDNPNPIYYKDKRPPVWYVLPEHQTLKVVMAHDHDWTVAHAGELFDQMEREHTGYYNVPS